MVSELDSPPVPPALPKVTIAVDLDDVLSPTNGHIAAWHNAKYGSNITLDNFYYYYYWKILTQNPFWGPPALTHRKVRDFYATDWVSSIPPIEGAQEGIAALRHLGYRLVIITARNESVRDASWEWAQHHFPGCFEELICTGLFSVQQRMDGMDGTPAVGNVLPRRLSKAEVCIRVGAKLLIDDSLENAIACAEFVPPSGNGVAPPVLLFGDYQWNKRLSLSEDERDDMSYAKRVELQNGDTGFLAEDVQRGEEAITRANEKYQNFVRRVRDWTEVVNYVTALERSDAFRL